MTESFPLQIDEPTASVDKTPMATTDQSSVYTGLIAADVAAEDVGLFTQLNVGVANDIATLDESNQTLAVEAGGAYA